MYKRRRSGIHQRRYGVSHRRRSGNSYKIIALILCVSVGCGYAAAKYVVEPVVNYLPQAAYNVLQNKNSESGNSAEQPGKVIEDDVDVNDTEDVSGYAVQFGCYSSRASAEAVKKNIDVQGLQIIDDNNMHKIIGEIYSDKEKAKKALAEVPEGIDAFVTAVYK